MLWLVIFSSLGSSIFFAALLKSANPLLNGVCIKGAVGFLSKELGLFF
jgi:hypothetical protein